MTLPMVDTRVLPVLTSALEALRAALEANPNPPASYSIRPGVLPTQDLSAFEDMCCEGAAWVRSSGVFPTNNFPVVLETATVCADPASLGVTVEMGVFRCVATGTMEDVVTDEQWTVAATQVLQDDEAMRVASRAMQQLAPFGYPGITFPLPNSFVMGSWAPIETDGGCVGGTRTFTIQVFCPE